MEKQTLKNELYNIVKDLKPDELSKILSSAKCNLEQEHKLKHIMDKTA